MFDFLIVAGLIFFLIFTAVDYYAVMAQHQIAEHVIQYYLERARIEGFLSSADEAEMVSKLASVGFTVENIQGPRESQGAVRVLRNVSDPDASRITLMVTAKPPYRPFTAGLLIGASAAPGSFRIKVGGSVLSERVEP
ncbi:MAG: hypothetical protein ACPLRW_07395 [Moorellales bacterium]